jgi:hypothetical protein
MEFAGIEEGGPLGALRFEDAGQRKTLSRGQAVDKIAFILRDEIGRSGLPAGLAGGMGKMPDHHRPLFGDQG